MSSFDNRLSMNSYQTLEVGVGQGILNIRIDRKAAKNSINDQLIEEMLSVLKQVAHDPKVKVVVLEGNERHFCMGMDFEEVSAKGESAFSGPGRYFDLLMHFTQCPQVMVAKVHGAANAGGVGLLAACDVVIASQEASFGLSEALFGLVPACVMPFLVRRIGLQKAQWLALSTKPINAEKAESIGLADEIALDIDEATRKTLIRLVKLDTNTIQSLKTYMDALWALGDDTRQLAIDKITSLMASSHVQQNIRNFDRYGRVPWRMEK